MATSSAGSNVVLTTVVLVLGPTKTAVSNVVYVLRAFVVLAPLEVWGDRLVCEQDLLFLAAVGVGHRFPPILAAMVDQATMAGLATSAVSGVNVVLRTLALLTVPTAMVVPVTVAAFDVGVVLRTAVAGRATSTVFGVDVLLRSTMAGRATVVVSGVGVTSRALASPSVMATVTIRGGAVASCVGVVPRATMACWAAAAVFGKGDVSRTLAVLATAKAVDDRLVAGQGLLVLAALVTRASCVGVVLRATMACWVVAVEQRSG